jgi:hypothetical protein
VTGFLFETYAAVWRMPDDDINAVVCIPVEVRSAPDEDGNVCCHMRRDQMFGARPWTVVDNHVIVPLDALVLDVA